jgi:biotin-[acetyl-CoA-carboxylase] ligase BirA-like protein
MLLLTDVPGEVRALVPGGVRPDPVAADALPTDERHVWRAFADDAPAFRAELPDAAFGLAGPLLVVGEAAASQVDRMQRRLAAGDALPDGLACVALAGARFHGQRGRPWAALRGNLHLSAHLAVDLDAAAAQAGLAVLPAVATAEAIEEVSGGAVRPGLKWVNDLLLDGHKVGGVLTVTQLQAGRVRHVVIGIGVNVARTPQLPTTPRAAPAGRLADADAAFGGEGGWARLLLPLARALARARSELAAGRADALVQRYRERAAFLGRHVTIWPVEDAAGAATEPLARGRVEALGDDLAVHLEGRAEPVRSGRMTIDDATCEPSES